MNLELSTRLIVALGWENLVEADVEEFNAKFILSGYSLSFFSLVNRIIITNDATGKLEMDIFIPEEAVINKIYKTMIDLNIYDPGIIKGASPTNVSV